MYKVLSSLFSDVLEMADGLIPKKQMSWVLCKNTEVKWLPGFTWKCQGTTSSHPQQRQESKQRIYSILRIILE